LWIGAYAASPTQAQEAAPEETSQLRWLARGDGVVVADRWIVRTNGTTESLPQPIRYSAEETRRWSVSISPDGGSVLWHDGSPDLQLGRLGAWDFQGVRVPLWVTPPSEEWSEQTTPLWMTQVASSPSGCGPPERACATYRVDSRTWRLEESCPASSYFYVGDVEPSGPSSWATFSYGVDLVSRSRPDELLGTLDLDERIEQVEHVRPDLALVVLPCEVDNEQRLCTDAARRWALYRWTPEAPATETEPALELVTRDLPRGARVSPRGDRIAWMQGEHLCTRALPSGTPRCIAPPRE